MHEIVATEKDYIKSLVVVIEVDFSHLLFWVNWANSNGLPLSPHSRRVTRERWSCWIFPVRR